MTKPFAVIFDMDGVIVDSNPYHKIALRQFAKKYGYDLSDQYMLEKIYGRTNKDWITNLFGVLPSEKLHELIEEKEELYRQLFKNDIKPVRGLVSFLEALERHHIPRAIGTSAPHSNVTFTLGSTHTGHFFETILDDSFVTEGKPNPEIYLKCAAALKMPPAQCIVIEDSLSGVKAGRSAGCSVVGITTTHTKAELNEAHFVIEDFEGLDPFFMMEQCQKS